jgi:hypothetical protein
VHYLLEIAAGTTVYLQGSAMGPFTLWQALELVLGYPQPSLIDRVEGELAERWQSEFYEVHAETSLLMARWSFRAGRFTRAEEYWREAGRYLAGYGYRKDVTVFGLIEGLDALREAEAEEVIPRLHLLQPLVDRALEHSDGKETWHAPGAWFAAFARAAPTLAARCLARTILRNSRVPSERLDSSFAAALAVAPAELHPLVCHLLWRTLPATTALDDRLSTVSDLLDRDRERGVEAFLETAAMVDGDTERPDQARSSTLREFAATNAIEDSGVGLTPENRERYQRADDLDGQAANDEIVVGSDGADDEGPQPLPDASSPLELVAALRRRPIGDARAPLEQERFAAELTERLHDLLARYDEATVLAVLEDFSRRRYFSGRAVALERVAERLESGAPGLAAEVYALAWCSTRDSWDVFGGLEHRDLMERAFTIDQDRALRRVAREIGQVVEDADWPMGISRRAVEALTVAGDLEQARATWDAACATVAYRLPQIGTELAIYVWPEGDAPPTEIAYGELAAAAITHPEYGRRQAALGLLAEALYVSPELAVATVETLLAHDTTFTDVLIALALLEEMRAHPLTSAAVHDQLTALAESGSFRLGGSAATLLSLVGESASSRTLCQPQPSPVIGDTEMREALAYDYGRRSEMLGQLWRRYPQLVARDYWRMWRSSARHERIRKAQAETQFSRSNRWVPPLHMHDWCRELLDIALDNTLPALRNHLIQNGRWRPATDAQIRSLLAPDAAASASRARSRIVRPAGPLPRDRNDQEGPSPEYRCEPFHGWIEIASWEREIVDAENWSSGTEFSVRAGVCAGEPTGRTGWPWNPVRGDFSWHRQSREGDQSVAPGFLVDWWPHQDATAWEVGLTLRPDVRGLLRLQPAAVPAPLDLVDDGGRVGCVYRLWRMRPFNLEFRPATPMILGGVLLLRPDLYEALQRATDALVATTRVEREELTAGS